MSGTHHQLLYHLVFSTKNRLPLMTDGTRESMFQYIGGTAKGLEAIPIIVGGWIDHIHLLVRLTTRHRLSDFMRDVKANSSRHANETHFTIHKFGWQDGYGAFTVGKTQESAVVRYIRNQEQHHAKQTFQQEYLDLLRKAEIEFDERFLWD